MADSSHLADARDLLRLAAERFVIHQIMTGVAIPGDDTHDRPHAQFAAEAERVYGELIGRG